MARSRVCAERGCPRLTDARLCPQHSKQRERLRGTSAQRGYDWRWRKASKLYRLEHPLCECDECKALGRVRASEVVDHIIPHQGNQSLFWNPLNWKAMSAMCHNAKTVRQDGGFGRT